MAKSLNNTQQNIKINIIQGNYNKILVNSKKKDKSFTNNEPMKISVKLNIPNSTNKKSLEEKNNNISKNMKLNVNQLIKSIFSSKQSSSNNSPKSKLKYNKTNNNSFNENPIKGISIYN